MRRRRFFIALITSSVIFGAGIHLTLGSERASALENDSSARRANSPALSIDLHTNRVSVEAKEGTWEKLLQELSRKTGIIFHITIPMESTVTVSFTDFPLERALQQLFGQDASFMFVYRNPQAKVSPFGLPSEVWIFGWGQRGISKTFGLQDTEHESNLSTLEDNDSFQEIAREFERNSQAARDAARRHVDPAIRVMAITVLGEQTTEEGIKVLLDILQDSDPHIRQSALDALAPSVENDPRVRKVMVNVMQKAEDADIRQMIADFLGVPLDKNKPGF